LKRTVRRAAQVRVHRQRPLVRRQCARDVPLLKPAPAHVIHGVRIAGSVFGGERKMRRRICGPPVVEQQEPERIVRANVLRIAGENTVENPLGFGGVAFLLTIQRRDGEVDLKIPLFRVG
jgi:hypothetical protein